MKQIIVIESKHNGYHLGPLAMTSLEAFETLARKPATPENIKEWIRSEPACRRALLDTYPTITGAEADEVLNAITVQIRPSMV
jgi:hypothetical protein